jgi:hypothetical protein
MKIAKQEAAALFGSRSLWYMPIVPAMPEDQTKPAAKAAGVPIETVA